MSDHQERERRIAELVSSVRDDLSDPNAPMIEVNPDKLRDAFAALLRDPELDHKSDAHEALRAAPMPLRESILNWEKWDEVYDRWWHTYASEDALLRNPEPRIEIRCETSENGVHGITYLNVIRVEREDDGSFTVVTDHWPRKTEPGADRRPHD